MCSYCWDLDEYESRHGHHCDDDCVSTCQLCDDRLCTENSFDGVCIKCTERPDLWIRYANTAS